MYALCRSIIWILLPFVSITAVPNAFWHILVWHFIENSIACYQYEIMVFVNLELSDIRFSFNDIHIATSVSKFSFRVSKGSGDWQPSWKNSNWSYNIFWLWVFTSSLLRILWVIFNWLCSCGLIDLSSTFDYAVIFIHVRWLMVTTQRHDHLATVHRDCCSTVTNIGWIASFTNYQNDNSTAARSINNGWISKLISSLTHGQKSLFSFFESTNYSFFRI